MYSTKRGPRKILKLKTTFIDRTQTDQQIFKMATQQAGYKDAQEGGVIAPLSDTCQCGKLNYFQKMIKKGNRLEIKAALRGGDELSGRV